MTTDSTPAATPATLPPSNCLEVPEPFQADYEQAKAALHTQAYAQAIDKYADLAQRLTASCNQNPLDPCLASVWYGYGMALYENAVQEANLRIVGGLVPIDEEQQEEEEDVGESDDDETPEEEKTEESAEEEGVQHKVQEDAEAQVEKLQAEAQKADQDSKEDNEDEEHDDAEEEQVNDFQAAWEAFETARLIYRSHLPEARAALAEVHLALGDLSLEEEKFDQAEEEYRSAMALKLELFDPQRGRRELAEVHYKLAMSLEYQQRYSDALKEMVMAFTLLKDRMNALASSLSSQSQHQPVHAASLGTQDTVKGKGALSQVQPGLNADDMKQEMEELSALLPDVTQRMEELKSQLVASQTAESNATASVSTGFAFSQLQPPPIQPLTTATATTEVPPGPRDLSGLIKKKNAVKRPEVEEEASAVAPLEKKVKI